jgi:nucleoside-diphosphate-sugar epimerase
MKILVTGGFGFIGSHLCEKLIENNIVKVITKSHNKEVNVKPIISKIIVDTFDITDDAKLQHSIKSFSPDVIFHLAGQTSHKKSFEDPVYDLEINSRSTLTILETIRKNNLKTKFILGSTFIVVGKNASLPISENTPCYPSTIYGTNRLTSEYYCHIYNQVYDIDTNVFRITNCFGPREQFLTPEKNAINYLIYQAYKGKEFSIYNQGKFLRDFIFVDDVIQGLLQIMKKGQSGNTYWLGSGIKTWFYEFAEILNELTKTKFNYVNSPDYTKKVDVGDILIDNSKLKQLGWEPKISLREGINLTLDYFNKNDL